MPERKEDCAKEKKIKMRIAMKKMDQTSLKACVEIWNQVVEDGVAFPQTEFLTEETDWTFFEGQTYTGAAWDEETGEVVGVYIFHPNNVGRCGHICNASYAVSRNMRGKHIGEYLVQDCMQQARKFGFRILQFNAVVRSNESALKLYKKLGFTKLGIIPGGFCNGQGIYEDIIPHYIKLV